MYQLVTLLKALTWIATFAVMFGAAARVGPASFWRVRDEPGLFARTLLAVWIVVPVFTAAVVFAFGVRGMSATMLLLMGVCPGLPVLIMSARSVKGSTTTALLALLLTAVTEPILIPVWTRLLSAVHTFDLSIRPFHVMRVLVPTVFAPVLLAFLLRARWPRLAERLARVADVLYLAGLSVKVVFSLVEGLPLLLRVPWNAYAAAIFISVGDAFIGYWAGRPEVEDQKALALATALGNPALAMAVVEVSYPELQASAMVSAYLIVRAVAITPFEWWLKRLKHARAGA